ncbi:MAG: alcohol dehydrogenase catalytic domain-containing protein [Proteobacteria bacterium]|nr:alcohol dehydrogenase catalytic domain-containing protein [Pseudomonadota bacterium]
MRACVITQFNRPWELQQLPEPRPAAGQVVVRIHASGLCGTDVHVHHGKFPVRVPLVAGHEPVGEVVELGAGVTTLQRGDRVGVCWTQKGCGRCRSCQEGRSTYCQEQQSWMNLGGGNAELMLAWAEGCTLLPDGLSYEEAAPIFCAGYTVFSGLRNADPRPGDRVAVLGIGGLGHLAVQYAAALGLEVIAVTSTDGKRVEARQLGASETLVVRQHVGEELMALGGVDVILSTTNSAAQVGQALIGLRPEGRLVNMGLVDGPIPVDPFALLMGQRRLIGSLQDERRDLVEALALVAAGKVKPRLELYPLDQANAARDRLETGKVRYRAVLQHAR